MRSVMCFARGDGRLLWQSGVTVTTREPTNGQNPYCSASPVTDGRRVIAYFGSPGLFCYDAESGEERWRQPLGKVDSWQGSGASPALTHRSRGTSRCTIVGTAGPPATARELPECVEPGET